MYEIMMLKKWFSNFRMILCCLLVACSNDKHSFVFLEGKALGIIYSISYQGDPTLSHQLDSIIMAFDATVNIERPDSEISRFNREGYIELSTPLLSEMIQTSLHFYKISDGAVNHCILPLIDAWGREFSNQREMHESKIDSLKWLCNPEHIDVSNRCIRAKIPGVKIDLNYLDKGYLIDYLSHFLMEREVSNFHIEFGTDLTSYGKNFKNAIINTALKNGAYSSSGNYEKFYVDETGAKHSHLIDPRSGYPIRNRVLSTHIKSRKCLQADALATICMILPLEEAIALIESNQGVEALIVYNQNGRYATWKTPGF
jgi:FAD:protein FMN transferase